MKQSSTKRRPLGSLLVLTLALLLVSGLSLAQGPQPEAAGYSYAFTYQGYLENGSGPVNGGGYTLGGGFWKGGAMVANVRHVYLPLVVRNSQ